MGAADAWRITGEVWTGNVGSTPTGSLLCLSNNHQIERGAIATIGGGSAQ